MRAEVLIVCLAVGVGTYLFRYLPTRIGGRLGASTLGGRLGEFLAAVGVASVAALLAAALEPTLRAAVSEANFPAAAAAVAGLGVTYWLFRWRKDVALATLAGAAAYGLVLWLAT